MSHESQAKLKELNEKFLESLHKIHQESPYCDFRINFGDYIEVYEQISSSVISEKVSDNKCRPNEENATSLEFNLGLLSVVKDELENSNISCKRENRIGPRTNYIGWHEYFMSVAQLAARRSKDPSTQVGACIVNGQNKIVATGYNGMPNGVDDNLVPWDKEGTYLSTKYAYVVHAELNAILNSVLTDQAGCRVYVSLFPCNECAKAIIQSGIRHVIFLSDKHKEKEPTKAAKIMFRMAGIVCEQYSSLK